MDHSALNEAQQPYQQYQQPDQNQQQPYDPAQAHAYDAYHHHQYAAATAAAYQNQEYYPHDHSSANAAASAAYYYYPPQSAAQPAAAPAPNDSSQIYAQQHHAVAAATPGHGQPQSLSQEQQGPAHQVPPGLNPSAAAAVAALSQLTQFAGTMDAAERAMAGRNDRQWHAEGITGPMDGSPPQPPSQYHHPYPHHNYGPRPMLHGTGSMPWAVGGRSPYKGGGRRVGRPFRGRGGGRGQNGTPPPYRGSGRGQIGRGGGRRSHQSDPGMQSPHTAPVAESSSALATAPVLPQLPLLPIAWCDICRVDCNSLEILEQHKNGKRHRRTVQRVEEIQEQQRLMAEIRPKVAVKPEIILLRVEDMKSGVVGEANKVPAEMGEPNKASVASASTPSAVVSSGLVEANRVSTASESMPNEALMTDPKMEPPSFLPLLSEIAPQGGQGAEAPPVEGGQTGSQRMDGSDRRRGSKQKMTRSGRGGKRPRFETVRERPVERPKEQPRFCILCNVMCDTPAVFEIHLVGKKHTSRIRRFQGPDAVFGPISVYIPPNQPIPSKGPEPLFYGLKSHEMLQQESYGLHVLPAGSFGLQEGDQAERAGEAGGAALGFPGKQDSEHLEGEVIPVNGGHEAVTLDTECQNTVMELESKEATIRLASEAAAMLGKADSMISEDVVPFPDYGENVVLPGLDVKAVEPSADNEQQGSGGASTLQ